MKRKPVLVGLGIALLLSLLLAYSLVGAMTRVYSCPAMAILDGSSCYLVRRENGWSAINVHGNLGTRVWPLPAEKCLIAPGLWLTTLTIREDGSVIRAFAPVNIVDVFRLKLGEYSHLGR